MSASERTDGGHPDSPRRVHASEFFCYAAAVAFTFVVMLVPLLAMLATPATMPVGLLYLAGGAGWSWRIAKRGAGRMARGFGAFALLAFLLLLALGIAIALGLIAPH